MVKVIDCRVNKLEDELNACGHFEILTYHYYDKWESVSDGRRLKNANVKYVTVTIRQSPNINWDITDKIPRNGYTKIETTKV